MRHESKTNELYRETSKDKTLAVQEIGLEIEVGVAANANLTAETRNGLEQSCENPSAGPVDGTRGRNPWTEPADGIDLVQGPASDAHVITYVMQMGDGFLRGRQFGGCAVGEIGGEV